MIKIEARFLRAAVGIMFISSAMDACLAQTSGSQGSAAPAAAPDPAFEAAKRAYDALPDAERRAIQEALIWTGDFNGVVGGTFGRATRAAIVAFAKRSSLPSDGTLDQKGREALIAAGAVVKTRVGFVTTRDTRTGVSIGLPAKILVKRADTPTGSRWTAADNAVALETTQSKESDGDLPALFDKVKDSTPTRKVTYKLLRPDFFVVTGEIGQTTFYTRMARGAVGGAGMLRGYSFTYPAAAKGNERVGIAIANAFEPFTVAPAAVAAAPANPAAPQVPTAPPVASAPPAPRATIVASAVAVSADRLITALARCTDPKIGARPARVVKQDEASGLMLLEAQGLAAKPLVPGIAGPAAGAPVVVLYQAARTVAANAAPAADTMAASGEILGAPARVLAPLQAQGAGGAVFDRNGGFVGIVGTAKTPTRVAGVVPQSAWPMTDGPALTNFLAAADGRSTSLAANGVRPAPNATPQSVSDIAAATRSALYPVTCTQ